MYRLIACDLDETLLGNDKLISDENVEAIHQAIAAGAKFAVATGRGYMTVQEVLKRLGLADLPDEYVISFNGGVIVENKNNRVLHHEDLPFTVADELYRAGLAHDVGIHIYTEKEVYTTNLTTDERDYLSSIMTHHSYNEPTLTGLADESIIKILYVNTDLDYLAEVEKEVADLAAACEVSYSSNRYLEFNQRGVNKGAGLTRLAERLEIPLSETLAIGDNLNDLSMLRVAGLGVGVANVAPAVRPYCDVITEASNDESAVAEALNRFVLNDE